MKIFETVIPRAKLDAVDVDERTAFLLLGHFFNHVSILAKWLCWTRPDATLSKAERRGRVTQSLLVLSVFSAKLNEGWELVRKQYYGTGVSKTYASLLKPPARESLKELARYFNNGAANLRRIRDEYAFHYDAERVAEAYLRTPQDESTSIYLAEALGMSLFHVSEAVAAHGAFSTCGGGDVNKGYDLLMDESTSVAKQFQIFIQGFLRCFIDRIDHSGLEEIESSDIPAFSEITIPFFAHFGK